MKRDCVIVRELFVLLPLGYRRTDIDGRTDAGCAAVLVRVGLGREGRRSGDGFLTGEGVSGQPSLPKPRA